METGKEKEIRGILNEALDVNRLLGIRPAPRLWSGGGD